MQDVETRYATSVLQNAIYWLHEIQIKNERFSR